MRKRPDARNLLYEKIRTSPAKFVHITGVPYAVERKADTDIVVLTVEVPPYGRLLCNLNIASRVSGDTHVRVGIIRSTWTEKPAPSLIEEHGLDYAKIEPLHQVAYETFEPEALAALLIEKGKVAVRAEVWGDLYATTQLGVRNIHCRRASAAVPAEVHGKDGALKLYFPAENVAEVLLFKFDGQ